MSITGISNVSGFEERYSQGHPEIESVMFLKFSYVVVNSFIFRASRLKSFNIFPEVGKLLGFPSV